MKKRTKVWLIVAAALVVLGCAGFGAVMTVNQWDFSLLDTEVFETKTFEIEEAFENISITLDTADVQFLPSQDGTCRVVCHDSEKCEYAVAVVNGTLTVAYDDRREWYDFVGFSFENDGVTVYLPEDAYINLTLKGSTADVEIPEEFAFEEIDVSVSTGDVICRADASENLKIKVSTGDVRVENITAGALVLSGTTSMMEVTAVDCQGDMNIRVTTGKVFLTDVACGSLSTVGSTGDLTMNHLIAENALSVERTTGDVCFEGCDAAEICIKTDTGDVTGSLLTEKVFLTETDTGKIDVPQSFTGGKCEISTDTGDIEISLP